MKCAKCGKEISLNDVKITESGELICSSCASNFYHQCNNCRNYISNEFNDKWYCDVCDTKVYDNYINSYGTKPYTRFKNRKGEEGNRNDRYYGLEMEFSNVNSIGVHSTMRELYKERYLYNKSDGSLSNGVEIVTAPCVKSRMYWLLDKMKPTLDMIKKDVKGYKYGAGIHIHVNRKSIDTIDIYKLSYMLNYSRYKDNDKKRIYYMVGRLSRCGDKIGNDHYYEVGKESDNSLNYIKTSSDGDRYMAFNITNTHTVEFRLFKTTCDVDKIKSYVEFVDKMIEFVHSHGFKEISMGNFIYWLKDNSTNNEIQRKIKRMWDYYGKQEHKLNDYSYSIDVLKDINYKDYEYLLKILSNYKFKKAYEMIKDFRDTRIKSGYIEDGYIVEDCKNSKTKLFSVMIKTLRSVLKNEIRKGVDLICA